MFPKYQHTCKSCLFLGTYEYEGPLSDGTTQHFIDDLYICPGDSLGPTILARHSSKGSDYSSMPRSILERIRAEIEAGAHLVSTTMPGMLEALEIVELRERKDRE